MLSKSFGTSATVVARLSGARSAIVIMSTRSRWCSHFRLFCGREDLYRKSRWITAPSETNSYVVSHERLPTCYTVDGPKSILPRALHASTSCRHTSMDLTGALRKVLYSLHFPPYSKLSGYRILSQPLSPWPNSVYLELPYPNIVSSNKGASTRAPGVPTHLFILLPFSVLSHPPVSPET